MGDNGSALALGAGGSYRMFINTNGNVGIGTSNPITTRKVSILGTGGTTNMIAHYRSDNAVPYVAAGYDETNDGYAVMTNQGTTDVNTNALFIKRTTNNIGMGTTAPIYPLISQIQGNSWLDLKIQEILMHVLYWMGQLVRGLI